MKEKEMSKEKTEEPKSKTIITKMALINLHISHDTGRRNMKKLAAKIESDNKTRSGMITASVRLIPANLISSNWPDF